MRGQLSLLHPLKGRKQKPEHVEKPDRARSEPKRKASAKPKPPSRVSRVRSTGRGGRGR